MEVYCGMNEDNVAESQLFSVWFWTQSKTKLGEFTGKYYKK